MKISIGMKLQPGPWGGGNRFGAVLTDYLRRHGHEVSHDLAADDLDVILLAEPDRKLRISAYDHADILRYLLFVNRRALVVHRINNSSEARDDPQKRFNRYRLHANRVADHTVFVSQWVRECYRDAGFGERPHTVILNGADQRLWRPAPESHAGERVPLRIVTHHWSMNPNKGWQVYRQLDALLGGSSWSERLQFTYIGPLPKGVTLQHGRHVAPITGQPLVDELRSHDLYLTASLWEAGPNHVLEGALCGLPLLYLESGSMREYCAGFGLPYTPETLENVLTRMIGERDQWAARMAGFPLTAERMCGDYLRLFETLVAERQTVLAKRRFGSSWSWVIQTLLNRHRRVDAP
ncbi:MAG: hypothetical protein HQL98_12005 [Magnetococcales bacterium]|nr:hypothetical protein [Magnetococcales bacterium]